MPADSHQNVEETLLTDDARAPPEADLLVRPQEVRRRRSRGVTAVATVGGALSVHFDVPAELLTRGDYRVTVRGLTAAGATEDVSNYSFRVAR